MTGKWHRGIATLASIIGLLGGLVIITDPSTLGIGADNWRIVGGWLAFGGSIVTGIATAIRGDWIPGVTTGVGNETPVG